ncbi:cytochrome c oxidase subunit II [Fulvimarina endophytica]|uniref:Cytochrome c oxidase subunit 2 n=1 Tax=Fulvimarina endophytica TaxID=2293836 RepID=A0A371X5H4_9HYPH|nr:cytochrome c oxidase subunit II [Fulvimarina endophytica]RFC64294.1 cytochrome c oxidase subunit II [Fulvimarina endophytica]
MKAWSLTVGALLAGTGAVLAQEAGETVIGKPHPWQLGLQTAYSPIEEQIHWFSDYSLFFIVPITIFVAGLLAWCVFRYRAAANPNPSRTAHNTTIEVIWTLAPVIVLLLLAIPSFQLLTNQYNPPREPELTVKATGYQWYWEYEYQPLETAEDPAATVSFASYPIGQLTDTVEAQDEAHAEKGDLEVYPRLLAVDNEVVVPVDTVVRVISTAADVIHSFAVPSLGVKVDAVPGRLNEYWFEANREGIFYGQCSELCGTAHSNMPIAVRAVSREQYDAWYQAAQDDVSAANEQLNAALETARSGTSVASR